MLNQVILVGLLIQEYQEDNDTYITLRVNTTPNTTNTRGSSDNYEIISCRLGDELSEIKQYLRLGSMLGVKAKISTNGGSSIIIDAQKITLIRNRRNDDD